MWAWLIGIPLLAGAAVAARLAARRWRRGTVVLILAGTGALLMAGAVVLLVVAATADPAGAAGRGGCGQGRGRDGRELSRPDRCGHRGRRVNHRRGHSRGLHRRCRASRDERAARGVRAGHGGGRPRGRYRDLRPDHRDHPGREGVRSCPGRPSSGRRCGSRDSRWPARSSARRKAPGEARVAWQALPPDVAVVILTASAAAWLGEDLSQRPDVLPVVMRA